MSAVISASVTTLAVTVIVPKCQNTQREAWVENRKQDLLPVPYFHVVFTVPDKLNGLFLQHPADLYNLLFACTWETIAQFSYTQLHAETGMVAILHTWGQNLSLHPHIHCVVPGGGINFRGQWKQVSTSEMQSVFVQCKAFPGFRGSL